MPRPQLPVCVGFTIAVLNTKNMTVSKQKQFICQYFRKVMFLPRAGNYHTVGDNLKGIKERRRQELEKNSL